MLRMQKSSSRNTALLLAAAVGWQVTGCDSGSSGSEPKPEPQPVNAACTVPTGTFDLHCALTEESAGCPAGVAESFETEWVLEGKLGSTRDSECTSTAKWSSASGCELEVTESCSDGARTELRAILEGDESESAFAVEATQSQPGCTAVYKGVAVRAKGRDAGHGLAAGDGGALRPKDAGVAITTPDSREEGPFTGEVLSAAMEKSQGGDPVPFWLYRGGFAPLDNKVLPIAADAVRHHAANPDLWTRWRRTSAGVERKVDSGWKQLAYDIEYVALPTGTKLNGTFSQDVVIGSTAGVQTRYRFAPDGSFAACKLTVFATGSIRPEHILRRGTYEVDGFVVRLRGTSGTNETESIVYDPARPGSAWVNNTPLERLNIVSTSTSPCDD